MRFLLFLIPALALASELSVEQGVPLRFGASFAYDTGRRVARFDGDHGLSLPIESAKGGNTEVVATVRLAKGRKGRLEVRGQGLTLQASFVGSGMFAQVSLGRGQLAPGLGRLEVIAPSTHGIELLSLSLRNVDATTPAIWPIRSAYLDLGKGSKVGAYGLRLPAGTEARLPVFATEPGPATLLISLPANYSGKVTASLGGKTFPFELTPGGARIARLAFPAGASLVTFRCEGVEANLARIELQGRAVSTLWPLPTGNAQSVHFGYPLPEGPRASWAYAEAIASPGPESTYHCVLGFGEGYFGYQVRYQRGRPDDRWFIYSLWDNGYVRNHQKTAASEDLRDKVVTLVAKGPGVMANAFDHEGSGGHSHLDFRWEDNQPYRFLLGVQPDGKAAVFSAWVAGPGIDGWRFLASFRRPNTAARLDGLYSFVEDWTGNQGDRERACRFRNLWVADAEGNWRRLTQAGTSATSELGRADYSHRVVGDALELRTGGFGHSNGREGQMLGIPTSGSAPEIDFTRLPRG